MISFESFFCSRYRKMIEEVERLYFEVRLNGGEKNLTTTALDVKLKRIGDNIFLISDSLEKVFEINEKNIVVVTTKLLQTLWDQWE